MSDFKEKSGIKEKLGNFEKTPFFTLTKPYLDFIGKGVLYNIIYIVFAGISLLFPFGILITVIRTDVLKYAKANVIVGFVFFWLVILFAGWVGFQLWWNRRAKIKEIKEADFVAIPMISDIVQTLGEWIGTLCAIIGFAGGLLLLIFNARQLIYIIDDYLPLGSSSVGVIFTGPLVGLAIIILFRLIAEFMRVVAALANNTKEIATNIKNKQEIN